MDQSEHIKVSENTYGHTRGRSSQGSVAMAQSKLTRTSEGPYNHAQRGKLYWSPFSPLPTLLGEKKKKKTVGTLFLMFEW